MDYEQLELIAETIYLHDLWHLGPPRRLQPPYCRPQPPYHRPFPPSSSVYIAQHPATPASSKHYGKGGTRIPYSGDPPASSSEVSRKPLLLPPPEIKKRRLCQGEENPGEGTTDSSCTLPVKKRLSRGVSNKETANEGDITGSVDISVPCLGEVCEEKGEAEEIVNEGHREGSMHVMEVSEEKGKAEEIFNEVNIECLIPVTVIFEGEERKEQRKVEAKPFLTCEDGLADANNMVEDEELCLSNVQLSQAEEFSEVNMEVSEEKGEAKDIIREINMDGSAVVMVILEGKVQGKAEAKAVFESEDGLADGNNLVGGKELFSSDAQVFLAEETVNHGDMKDSMDVIVLGQVDACEKKGNVEEPAHDGDREGPMNVTVSCQHDAEVIVNEGDKESPMDVTVSCQSNTWDAEKVGNEGDKESSMDVTVSCQGDTWEAEEIVNEGGKKGSMEVTVSCQGNTLGAEKIVHDRDKEESMNVTVSCQHHTGEAQDMVNEGDIHGLRDVIVPCHEKGEPEKIVNEGDMECPMDVLKIVEDMNMESLIAVTVNYDGEVCKEQGKAEEIVNEVNLVGSIAVTVISDDERTDDDDDGKMQGWVDATVSCVGEASREKAKAKVLQEDGGAGTNGSTSNGGRWPLKKCSEKSCGLKLSEARFVLYNIDDGSHILQLPTINLANTQALEQFGPLDEYTGGVEAVKNCVWGNTFFVSRRTAKLLGHILAGGFQYTPSLPDIPASSSQPPPSAKKPKPRTCKLQARV